MCDIPVHSTQCTARNTAQRKEAELSACKRYIHHDTNLQGLCLQESLTQTQSPLAESTHPTNSLDAGLDPKLQQ